MNKQSQWLFEVPPTSEGTESSFEVSDGEWEVAAKPGSIRRSIRQPLQQIRTTRSPAAKVSNPIRQIQTPPRTAKPQSTNGRGSAPGKPSQPPQAPGRVLTYNDVRSDRIDVFAQRALLRMSKNPAMSADAAGMADAVKTGKLGGIYKEDEKVPALRTRKMNSSWWLIIPKGEDAVLFLDPEKPKTGTPIIVFRDSVRSDAVKIDPALQKAWRAYLRWQRREIQPCQCQVSSLNGQLLKSSAKSSCVPLRTVVPGNYCTKASHSSVSAFPKKYNAAPQPKNGIRGRFAIASFQRDGSFPNQQSSELHHNQALQKRLENAINTYLPPTEKGKTSFAIVQLNQERCHQWAGFLQDQVHYSASLIKIAAIYAAHELRAAANRLVKALKPETDKELFDALEREFTPQITEKIESILTKLGSKVDRSRVPPGHPSLKPNYKIIFQSNSKNPNQKRLIESVEFDEKYDKQLTAIVRDPGSNAHATFCIHGLGYGYIIGALESAGLFNSTTGAGIWLAGDYAQQWPYIRIDSVNDGKVAQATTALKMAELFTLLWDKKLFDDPTHPNSSSEMLNRLRGDFTWTGNRDQTLKNANAIVTHSKVGSGDLKPVGPKKIVIHVFSEAFILRCKMRDYVVVWQNYSAKKGLNPNVELIAKVIMETISEAAEENCATDFCQKNCQDEFKVCLRSRQFDECVRGQEACLQECGNGGVLV